MKEIINFYKDHTGRTTCKQFNLTQKQLNSILDDIENKNKNLER